MAIRHAPTGWARRPRRDRGFTLIELLVVVIIIGLLVAIAVPLFAKQRQRAQDATLRSDLRSAALSVNTYFTDDVTWADFRELTGTTQQLRLAGDGSTSEWNDFASLPAIETTPGTIITMYYVASPGANWRRAHQDSEFCLAARRTGSSFIGGSGGTQHLLYYDVAAGGIKTVAQVAAEIDAGREPSCASMARTWINAGRR